MVLGYSYARRAWQMRDDMAQVYGLLLAQDTLSSLAVVDEEGESCFTLVTGCV